ncbi:MAG: hypothetical protein Q4A56_05775 [Porphyromonadaceae bacterium]|nr:hypothetical protein [Porphyromonadaceae bacterium]
MKNTPIKGGSNSRRKKGKKIVISSVVIFLSIFLFLKYYIGFHHIPNHLETIKNSSFSITDFFFRDKPEYPTVDTTIAVNIVAPIDTLIWTNADFIPENVRQEIEEYKKRDFSKLVIARDFPTDIQAQRAIIHHYKSKVVDLLQKNNAHIKIGTCYDAPLQDPTEAARVTAMVCAFNEKKENLGNIQLPLDIIYDFVKFHNDTIWYITDFSQNIPYDYKLNKNR